MACDNCNQIETPSCDTCYCNETVCTPCEHVHADRCIKVTSALPNIGACNNREDDYLCADLNTVLLAIDNLLDDCADGTCSTNTVSVSAFNRLCNESVTIDYPSGIESQISGNIAYMRYWTTSPDTESLVYVDDTLAKLAVDDGTNVSFVESRGASIQTVSSNGVDSTQIASSPTNLGLNLNGSATLGVTGLSTYADNATALAALGANKVYKLVIGTDTVLAITV